MKINFTHDTEKEVQWPVRAEIESMLEILRRKGGYKQISAYLAMTPSNYVKVKEIIQSITFALFESGGDFYYYMALTKDLEPEDFLLPQSFAVALTKALTEDLAVNRELYERAHKASYFYRHGGNLNLALMHKYNIYGIKFESKKQSARKTKLPKVRAA